MRRLGREICLATRSPSRSVSRRGVRGSYRRLLAYHSLRNFPVCHKARRCRLSDGKFTLAAFEWVNNGEGRVVCPVVVVSLDLALSELQDESRSIRSMW